MKLTQSQAADLVNRLATDDAFRELIGSAPEKALAELGVSAEAFGGMTDPSRAKTCSLASKAAFAEMLASLKKGGNTVQMDMTVPTLKLD
jgi:putative modified peptide